VLFAHSDLIVGAVIAGIAALFIVREFRRRRAAMVEPVLATMANVLGVHDGAEPLRKRGGKPATKWRHGKLVMVRVSYPRHVIAHPKARANVDLALEDLLGEAVHCEWPREKRTVKMTVTAPAPVSRWLTRRDAAERGGVAQKGSAEGEMNYNVTTSEFAVTTPMTGAPETPISPLKTL
jgi:hypothetical protein